MRHFYRYFTVLSLAFIALLVGGIMTFADNRPAPSVETSVVKVVLAGGHGSGVYIGDGFIITAAHVAEGQQAVVIQTKDGRRLPAEVLWTNHDSDVSLLKVTSPDPVNLSSAQISCATTAVGRAVRLEGSPSDIDFAKAWGRVSAFGKTGFEHIDGGRWKVLVTLDLTAAPGDSGGPIYDDATNKVVGILVSAMVIERGNFAYSYMVPSTEICKMLGRSA